MDWIWTVIPAALTFILGLAIQFKPKLTKRTNGAIGEIGEAMVTLAGAVSDGQITREEADQIVADAKNVVDLWRKTEEETEKKTAKKPAKKAKKG